MRHIGTVSRGIRLPIVVQGDDIVKIVVDQVLEASQSSYEPFEIRNKDIVGITESLVARAQGNYVTPADIAEDVRAKIPEGDAVILFPLLSRNRFYPLLKGIIDGIRGKVHILFSYPTDEVGNQLISPVDFYSKQSILKNECFDEEEFYAVFGSFLHPFTGVDYIKLYKEIAPDRVVVHFSNNPMNVFEYGKNIIVATIHARELHKELLKRSGATIIGLDDICTVPVREGMGYNEQYGLLGSNNTGEDMIKLFPRDSERFVQEVRASLKKRTGKDLEVLVYGDGAFKDPVCGIWELADPVVSPAFTDGLRGVPNEIKLKYVADNAASGEAGSAVMDAIRGKKKGDSTIGEDSTLGTTPRRFPDLVGSLCDLTSGSGDKGTPVVYISGYFDNYSDQ